MAAVKFKSQEEFDAFKKKMAAEAPVDNNPIATKGPEDQRVKVYTRPDMREGAEPEPGEQNDSAEELNRKLRDSQRENETSKSFSEKHPRLAKVGEAIKGAGHTVKEELKRISKNAEKLEKKEKPTEEPEKEEELKPSKKSKKSKKSKHVEPDEDFDEDSESMHARSSGKKPFSTDYKEVYSGKKVLSGDYKEVYKGRMGTDEYASPKVPKTHGNFLQQQRAQPQPIPQARALLPMPRVGNFKSGNVKMPMISFGGSGFMPKVAMPSTGNHKIGRGSNMPSINIPTLGGSTLLPGMGKKMGSIPKIGNWGKESLKTELNLPNIGNLTIMGAGKKKGGISFGLGEIPSLSLGAPQKKKKV